MYFVRLVISFHRRIIVKFCIPIFAAAIMFTSSGAPLGQSNSLSEDFIVHCSALYAIVYQAYAYDNNNDAAEEYERKFETLKRSIEARSGKSAGGSDLAEEEIQSRVNELSRTVTDLYPILPRLVYGCDNSEIIKGITGY